MSRKLVTLARAACGRDLDAGLDAIRQMRDELSLCEADHVAHALAEGWSWARIGRALGVSRQAVHRRYAARPPVEAEPRGAGKAGLSQRSRLVLALARSEASARRDAVTATEHILMGLIQEGEGPAARALAAAGLDLRVVRAVADVICPSGLVYVRPSQLALSRRAQAALSYAAHEAVERGDAQVSDLDLMHAVFKIEDSGALNLMRAVGASPDDIVEEPPRPPRRRRGSSRRAGTAGAAA